MTTVTLIGARLAEADREFVYGGEAPGCTGCPYRGQCLNLDEGVRYRVTEVRDEGQLLDCAVHDEGVRAVEVEPAPVTANVLDNVAFAGNKTSLAGPCPHTDCPSHEFCVPDGAEFDTEYRVDGVLGDPPHDYCALDRDLTMVEFAPADED
jgi:uncharacterized protein (UPF0179 family)